ncbi:MAG TPA: hypothetical protein VFP92_04490 [Rhodanobacteraceae bacterium]|nr:hypothetical protein [Rhodanobacteraceae bacterium]
MTSRTDALDADAGFAARQYGHLIESGLSADEARARLAGVLGEDAVDLPGPGDASQEDARPGEKERIAELARRFGGDGFAARTAWSRACDRAQLFALDWWRPVRSFVLYALYLYALAIAVVLLFVAVVLPSFASLDRMTGVWQRGAAAWVMAHDGVRLILPLVCIGVLLVLFALGMLAARRAVASLRPLPGAANREAWYGASGRTYALVRAFEQLSALERAGVPPESMSRALQQLGDDIHSRRIRARWDATSARLQQALELGTFPAELAWQKREAWSQVQTHWELARDRWILVARILFYIFVGYLVTVLYRPIFALALQVVPKP